MGHKSPAALEPHSLHHIPHELGMHTTLINFTYYLSHDRAIT